jgi:hypothetical protein
LCEQSLLVGATSSTRALGRGRARLGKAFLASEDRLAEPRAAYRAHRDTSTKAARERQRAILEEAIALRRALTDQLDATLG